MKIDIRDRNHFRSEEWEGRNHSTQENLLYKIPPKGTPTIEVLPTEPPTYRINGRIVELPKGMSPEEYYQRYMGGHAFIDTDEENKKGI